MNKPLYNKVYKYLSEITDVQGKKIDNVKIDDIVKTPDGHMGKYIKKKEYAIIDLGNGQIKEAEIDSLQLVKAAPEEPKEEPTKKPEEEKESISNIVEGFLTGDINVSTGDIGFLGGAGSIAKSEQESAITEEDDSFKDSKILYVVGYKDKENNGEILYRSEFDDLPDIWNATLFATEEEAKAEIEHEYSAHGFDPEDYFVRPIKFCY